MATESLATALKAEESIWKVAQQSESLFGGSWTAYCNPLCPTNPQWNALYPAKVGASLSKDELRVVQELYSRIGCTPHIVDTTSKHDAFAISEDEYFVLPPNPELQANLKKYKLTIIPTKDAETFAKTVQMAFEYDKAFFDDFRRQVKELMDETKSYFYIVKRKKSVCATFSVTLTPTGHGFIMNCGVLPDYRSNGIPKQLFLWSAQQFKIPMLTHTAHEPKKKREMPKCGFVSLGSTHLVPVAALMG